MICNAIKEAEPDGVPRFPRDDLLATVYAKVSSRWIATLRCSFVEVFEVVSRRQRRIRKVLPRSSVKTAHVEVNGTEQSDFTIDGDALGV